MASPIDLNPRSLHTVERILADHVPDCEVRAFGSRATWTAWDYSDLDLAVVGEGPTDPRILGDLREAFEESDLPIRVDVVDWHTIDDAFRSRIKPDCVVIHEFPRQAATRFRVGLDETATPDVPESYSTIGEFTPFVYGKSLPKRQRNPQGHARVYGSNGIVGHHDSALTSGPTIIIGRKGTVGAVHYSPEPCWPIDTTFFVEGDDPVLHRFKYYALKDADLLNMNADSAVPGLNRNEAHTKRIYAPPVAEQRSIARVLGALDDKIELNRRMSETLEEMARALFRSWFVDFDPVRAKAEGRPSGLPPNLDALFPDSFKPSELGEIPEGWRVLAAGDAVAVRGGTTPRTNVSAYWNGAHCFATPRELSQLQHPVLASTSRHLTDAGLARIGSGILPTGTVLLSSRAPIGYTAIADIPVAINQGIIAIVCQKGVNSPYVLHWIQSSMATIIGHASGTTFAEISKSSFRELPFLVPSKATHAAWDSLVSPFYDLVGSRTRESSSLRSLRDTLLPKLLSGELRVPTGAGQR